jgi:UDPglucose 6-dehydrogenase
VTVVGSGYVGLVVGACLAEVGNEVACADADAAKIEALRRGEVPLYEPGLEAMIRSNLAQGRLRFTAGVEAACDGEVIFIAVGTPSGEDGGADVQHVVEAAEQIGRALRRPALVVLKSTVPVGTAERVEALIRSVTSLPVEVVSNPEFLKEGAALRDFLAPDRVVIGAASESARAVMEELYRPFAGPGRPVLLMDRRSAELTKYAANAMLATRISFMNDIARLCERAGADVEKVRAGVGADRRIGAAFLSAGIGFGGSCFPKDLRALEATGRQLGVSLELLAAVERTNQRQKRLLVDKAQEHYGSLRGKFLALWGLAFKPETDDLREAPSLEVIDGLLGLGAEVRCHDPVAEPTAERLFQQRIRYAPSIYDCVEGTDGLFIVTEWRQFREPDLERIRRAMREPVIFDGRNLLDADRVRGAGFTYYSVGRP